VGLVYGTGCLVLVVVDGYFDLLSTGAPLCSVILCHYLGYKRCRLSGPMVGIVWCSPVGALIINAQPFGFLMGRHCIVCCGETFHHVGESLV